MSERQTYIGIVVNFNLLKLDLCSTHGRMVNVDESWSENFRDFDEQTYFDILADLEAHFRVEEPIVAFLQFNPGKCSIAFGGKGYGTSVHILSCDEIYVVREYLRLHHLQLSTFWILLLSLSQFWYGPEIHQNTSKRRIDNPVGWVARWNKSYCRTRIFWLLRRMQPISNDNFYSIDNDISSKMSVFTGNLENVSHVFLIHCSRKKKHKPTLRVQHNSLRILTAKQVLWIQSATYFFFATRQISRFARNFPRGWQPTTAPEWKKFEGGDPDVVEIYPAQIIKHNGQWLWYSIVWNWILMLVE